MLQVAQLRALCAVLDAGSFAGAGQRLSLTASAISQQISTLEHSLGIQLFVRHARSIEATAAAATLGLRAKSVLAQIEILGREAHALRTGARGVVRVGSFPSASARLLPSALARLSRKKAGVEVLLEEDEPDALLSRLQSRALDVALLYCYDVLPATWPSGLTYVPLAHEALVLLTAGDQPALAPDLSDADKTTWVASREDTAGWRCLTTLCHRAGFAPRVNYRSNDYDVVRGLVAAGLGIALVPALAHLPDAELRGVALTLDGAHRTVYLAWRNDAAVSIVNSFRSAVRHAVRSCASPFLTPT